MQIIGPLTGFYPPSVSMLFSVCFSRVSEQRVHSGCLELFATEAYIQLRGTRIATKAVAINLQFWVWEVALMSW